MDFFRRLGVLLMYGKEQEVGYAEKKHAYSLQDSILL